MTQWILPMTYEYPSRVKTHFLGCGGLGLSLAVVSIRRRAFQAALSLASTGRHPPGLRPLPTICSTVRHPSFPLRFTPKRFPAVELSAGTEYRVRQFRSAEYDNTKYYFFQNYFKRNTLNFFFKYTRNIYSAGS